MTVKEKIGQLIIAGFSGTKLTSDFIKLVEEQKISNVILFSTNIENSDQLKQLCSDIQDLVQKNTGTPAFIAIDQEGGVVTRLPNDATNVPGAMAIAASGNPKSAYQAGLITGIELCACGINFNFAPVVDINSDPNNPVIGVRSYGDTPQTVISYSTQMLKGLQDGGVLCGVKHFPGHGDTDVDSHVGLPIVDKSMHELDHVELMPFKAAIDAGADAVMTTHILFPQLENNSLPATMSYNIITKLLKEKMGFNGLVISDCLEMDAVKRYYGTAKGALYALKAGVDLLCISHTASSVIVASELIEQAIISGELSISRLDQAADKVLLYKTKLNNIEIPSKDVIGCKVHMLSANKILQDSITLVNGNLQPLGDNPLFIGCYAYRSTIASSAPDINLNFAEYMQNHFGGSKYIINVNPSFDEIDDCVNSSHNASCVVIGTYNGHINKTQIELANRLCNTNNNVVVIALRNPYDLAYIDKKATCIATYEYSKSCFNILIQIFNGIIKPTGKLSVKL